MKSLPVTACLENDGLMRLW